WQAHSGNWDRQTMIDDIARGLRTLEEIIGQPVTCSAAAGWRADQQVIEAKEAFHLRYNSDCRGAMPFRPLLESGTPGTAQIPVTLPTWDEVIGRDVKAEDFNGWLLNRILRDKGTPVYTIHAEVEGCAYQHNFVDLLKRAAQEGVTFCPLSELLSGTLPLGQVVRGNIAGREGWLGCQQIAGSH
ncbi:MAG: 4-deoxy-4-formamido-L-arabinose-phosphoundecaprenol deformylase, partial [Escherichia coli]|nr:4-deoxy-4-formamido-L-arabinose-phosphoundecaprenol deformylase [Escherichia coli]